MNDWLHPLHPVDRIDETLWMGGLPVGKAPAEFDYIFNMAPFWPYETHERQVVVTLKLYDGPEVPDEKVLHAIADCVNVARKAGRVLVHCQMGLNRSGIVAALALIKSGMKPKEAISLLRARRGPDVLCNPVFEAWLVRQGAV